MPGGPYRYILTDNGAIWDRVEERHIYPGEANYDAIYNSAHQNTYGTYPGENAGSGSWTGPYNPETDTGTGHPTRRHPNNTLSEGVPYYYDEAGNPSTARTPVTPRSGEGGGGPPGGGPPGGGKPPGLPNTWDKLLLEMAMQARLDTMRQLFEFERGTLEYGEGRNRSAYLDALYGGDVLGVEFPDEDVRGLTDWGKWFKDFGGQNPATGSGPAGTGGTPPPPRPTEPPAPIDGGPHDVDPTPLPGDTNPDYGDTGEPNPNPINASRMTRLGGPKVSFSDWDNPYYAPGGGGNPGTNPTQGGPKPAQDYDQGTISLLQGGVQIPRGSFRMVQNAYDPNRPDSWGLLGQPANQIAGDLDAQMARLSRSLPEGGERNLAREQAVNQSFGQLAGLRQGLVNQALGYVENSANQKRFGVPLGNASGAGGSLLSGLNQRYATELGGKFAAAGLKGNGSDNSLWTSIFGHIGKNLASLGEVSKGF